jgi:hypothetical protein
MGLGLYLSHEFIKLMGKLKINNKIFMLINLRIFKQIIYINKLNK